TLPSSIKSRSRSKSKSKSKKSSAESAGGVFLTTRFMESPLSIFRMHRDHDPRTSRTVPPTRCCRRLVGRAFLRFLCRQDAGSTLRFMESPLSAFFHMHWDHEPKTRNLFICKRSIVRFMENPHDFDAVHRDHEPAWE